MSTLRFQWACASGTVYCVREEMKGPTTTIELLSTATPPISNHFFYHQTETSGQAKSSFICHLHFVPHFNDNHFNHRYPKVDEGQPPT